MKRTNSALGVLSGLSLVIKSIVQEQSAQTRLVWRASSVRDIAKSMRESASTAAEYVQPWKPPQDSPAAILERENGDEELPRESVEENSDKMASNEETRTEDSDLGMRHDEQATEHTTQTVGENYELCDVTFCGTLLVYSSILGRKSAPCPRLAWADCGTLEVFHPFFL